MGQTRTRVVGSGFTTFNYRGRPIAFLDRFQDSGQAPIVGPETIHPLGLKHPAEFATPRATEGGTLTIRIRELWDRPAWQELFGLAGTRDIIEVYERIAAFTGDITCQMIIKPPPPRPRRGKVYHGIIIATIDDSEIVEIGTLTVPRTMTLLYTHTTPLR